MKTLQFKTIPIALSLLLTAPLLAPDAAYAGRPERAGKSGEFRGNRHDRILRQLDLSDEQKKKLADLREANREKSKEARAEMRKKREALEKALDSDASSDELRRLHQDLQKTRIKLGDLRFDQVLAVREVLTAEQRKKFKDLKAEKREKKRHRRGHADE